jgi:signal transduction histidine kinase
MMEDAYAAGAPSSTMNNLAIGKVQLIHDGRRKNLEDERYAAVRELVKDAAWDTLLGVPIVYRGVGLGMLVAAYPADSDPDPSEISFLEAIADQAAIAIENSRLFNRASSLAALQERQRLARELHDSVSQALYGIALGARTARRRLESDPGRVGEPLDYVLSLAEAGLTEMRALIFELRPESLAEEGLVAAITRQVAAMRARYGIDVEADLCEEPGLDLRAKEALYRIAQEALHNTVKHARATNIIVRLASEDGRVVIDLRDNGQGFDPGAEFPGHLGLRSMRERVGAVGGSVELTSTHGQGTHVRAWVPV